MLPGRWDGPAEDGADARHGPLIASDYRKPGEMTTPKTAVWPLCLPAASAYSVTSARRLR